MMGGLGSQMFKFAFYELLRNKVDEDIYIDNNYYKITKQWNGYELDRIFGIEANSIDIDESIFLKRCFSTNQYRAFILNELSRRKDKVFYSYRSQFFRWEGKPKYIFIFKGLIKDTINAIVTESIKMKLLSLQNNEIYNTLADQYSNEVFEKEKVIYFDEFCHNSDFYFAGIRSQLIGIFQFKPFDDTLNKKISLLMAETESVAIHIRRGDHLFDNGDLVSSGYYLKSINLIKNKIFNPIFFIFSDDLEWCRENIERIGLSDEQEEINFINWNTAEESYRDMQLMTYCKHHVLAISSFGWWGYYLARFNNGVSCAPNGFWDNVQYHF